MRHSELPSSATTAFARVGITALLCLSVGFGAGWHFGFTRPIAEANREAMKRFTIMDTDDTMAATIALKAIPLIDSGKTDEAVKALVWPIGAFYRSQRHKQSVAPDNADVLARIEQLAKSNSIVAAEIARELK